MNLREGTIGNPGAFGAIGRTRTGWTMDWGVAQRYEIDDHGTITPVWPPEINGSRRSRAYDPLSYPSVATVLANVVDDAGPMSAPHSEQLLRQAVHSFVSDWGLPAISGPPVTGRPKTGTVREVWKLAQVAKMVIEAVETKEFRDVWKTLDRRLRAISPMLVFVPPHGLRYAMRVPTLSDAVALHLSDLAIGGTLGTCEACGRSFIITDARMRYCPGIKGVRASRCAERQRKRRLRKG